MNMPRLSFIIASGLTLIACDQTPSGNMPANAEQTTTAAAVAPADTSEVVATINGTNITRDQFQSYSMQRMQRRPNDPGNQNPQAVLDEIINLELALQDGIKQGIDKQPEVVSQIEQQRRSLIAGAGIRQALANKPITDEELKKIYDEKTTGAGKEYKARHILVEDETKAKELITKLDGGADFSELAKEHSTGPSGKNGGDLGWFSPQQMVKEFSDAAAALEKGTHTKAPVKTQFGWHIIVLDDSRESSAPPFEQLKPQLQAFAQNERVQGYINQLRETATINITDAFKAQLAPVPAPDDAGDEGHENHAGEEKQPTDLEGVN